MILLTVMFKKLDLTNSVHGRLTAICQARVIAKNTFWICRCSCDGLYSIFMGKSLTAGRIRSCGCLRREVNQQKAARLAILNTLAPGEAALNQLYASYEWHATVERGYSFDLTRERFKELTKGDCFYCGSEPKQISKNTTCKGVYIYNGVDRKNNNLGYSIDNCVPACGSCNKAKGKKSVEEFLALCKLVNENTKREPALEANSHPAEYSIS